MDMKTNYLKTGVQPPAATSEAIHGTCPTLLSTKTLDADIGAQVQLKYIIHHTCTYNASCFYMF
jgi:hypothetical protein